MIFLVKKKLDIQFIMGVFDRMFYIFLIQEKKVSRYIVYVYVYIYTIFLILIDFVIIGFNQLY